MKAFILASLICMPFAQAEVTDCIRQITHFDNTQTSRDFWPENETCFISVHPRDSYVDLIYRDYLLTNKGLLMVFNSYGHGESHLTTGAREFYFFPRSDMSPQFSYNQNSNEVRVKFSDRLSFVFDGKTAQIKSLSQGSVSVASDVNKNNQGGVEIQSFNGLWLDVGFAMGQSPSEKGNMLSKFTDENGQTCSVKNKDIFQYINGDVEFRFSDADLKIFLKRICPKLQVSF
jgi:hypothetical protein